MAEEQEPQLNVGENLSIRYGDVTISITADPEGLLVDKTNEQIVKFCADLLLRTTEENSIENFLDTTLSIQETLVEDFGWKELDASMFMAAWRKRLYLKQIGEQNPPAEDFENFRAIKDSEAKPESDKEEEKEEDEKGAPQVMHDGNHVTIGIPVSKKNILTPEQADGTEEAPSEEPEVTKKTSEPEETVSFTIVEKEGKGE